jgi:hypothetical protein
MAGRLLAILIQLREIKMSELFEMFQNPFFLIGAVVFLVFVVMAMMPIERQGHRVQKAPGSQAERT